jgi:hypothetical protein
MRISILGTNVADSKYSSHNQVFKNPKKIPSGSTANLPKNTLKSPLKKKKSLVY